MADEAPVPGLGPDLTHRRLEICRGSVSYTLPRAELDCYLVLLGKVIRQRGFTRLKVQQELGWGKSYISQLLTKQKSLRVEQVLLILRMIGIEPAEFFVELYAPPEALYGLYKPAPPRGPGLL